jgi:hypothetical protein
MRREGCCRTWQRLLFLFRNTGGNQYQAIRDISRHHPEHAMTSLAIAAALTPLTRASDL